MGKGECYLKESYANFPEMIKNEMQIELMYSVLSKIRQNIPHQDAFFWTVKFHNIRDEKMLSLGKEK